MGDVHTTKHAHKEIFQWSYLLILQQTRPITWMTFIIKHFLLQSAYEHGSVTNFK